MEKYGNLTDTEILPLLRAADRDVFHIVYNRYRNKVYSVALNVLRDELDAEEVMQEVMLKLWLSVGTLKDDSNLEAYLKTLTRNLSYNVLRRQALVAKTAISRGLNWKDYHNETEEQIILSETKRVLQDAIERLPPQQKVVYQLCQQDGLKYEEAAKQLNLSAHTVQGYMKLALRSVRTYVSVHTDVAVVLVIFGLLKK
ncbi:RNA polymerase sigma factor [Pedobacter nyackensis]|uniref:RNA polymerase sigma-70 factor, ECF subfamily n=1 Tax=Pedobacter nyackensis TaxID=475255 RepID=A0A1W2A374_9SPHI|nr:sigma-70 family RNA polymerase sigma factor [Pedobacter nyackensis]SMC54892.1 RNA polymerase sigma-70 factor, ECF subfamily [Pedobacter nyackensis]